MNNVEGKRCAPQNILWLGGRVDYGSGLENRRGLKTPVGSNPTLASIFDWRRSFSEGSNSFDSSFGLEHINPQEG